MPTQLVTPSTSNQARVKLKLNLKKVAFRTLGGKTKSKIIVNPGLMTFRVYLLTLSKEGLFWKKHCGGKTGHWGGKTRH